MKREIRFMGCWMRAITTVVFLFVLWFGLQTKTASTLSEFQYTQLHMGVQARIIVYAKDKPTAESACEEAFHRIAALEQIMSDYRPSSELMQLCTKAGGSPVKVSEELFIVLSRAQEVSRLSNGAFDVTVGPIVALWRTARKTHQFPTNEERIKALQLVGWQKVHLNPKDRKVQLDTPGMKLDLGGIAKGYALDEALKVLNKHGIQCAYLELGGDIVVGSAPSGKKGWEILVTTSDLQGKKVMKPIFLTHAALSTSGDSEQFVEFDGKRYSHIVDPHTGIGLTNRIQVSVKAKNGLTSDSLSKPVCVLGVEKTRALLRRYGAVVVGLHQGD